MHLGSARNWGDVRLTGALRPSFALIWWSMWNVITSHCHTMCMTVSDVPGGPGWVLDGTTLHPRITDLSAFRESITDDVAAEAIELLWTGNPKEAATALHALSDDMISSFRRRALLADCFRDMGDTARACAEYSELLTEVEGTAREAVVAQHYAKAAVADGDLPRAYVLFDRAHALRVASGSDETLLASSAQGLAWMADRTGLTIKDATPDDAEAIARIYAPYVQDTIISFELTTPPADVIQQRMDDAHEALVALIDGTVRGYAYASTHRSREAYARTAEVSVYVETGWGGRKMGTYLYSVLLDRLRRTGFHMALGGVTQPNEASVALHTSLGFELVGIYRDVGRKFDQWHDVAWYQRRL